MTDIVERLRTYDNSWDRTPNDELAMQEAADEIERLRAVLQEIADLRYTNTSAATIAHLAMMACAVTRTGGERDGKKSGKSKNEPA